MSETPPEKKVCPVDLSPFRDIYPFSSNYMDIRGFSFHYLDEGKGDPLVMLHGNPTWSFYYRRLVSHFSAGYRTIVPDHIGCGLSDKPSSGDYDYTLENRVKDLEEFLGRLNLDRKLTLIVHDWGGMIGMAFALRHPEIIGRIVITNTAGFFPPGKKGIPLRLWVIRNLTFLAAPMVLGGNLFCRGALFMATKKGLSPEVKKGLSAPYDSWKNRIATLCFVQDIPLKKGDRSYEMVEFVDENIHLLSDIPMLICWGMGDFVFDEAYLAEWKKRFPEAFVREYKDAGHYLLEDEPEKVTAAIEEFLKKHPV